MDLKWYQELEMDSREICQQFECPEYIKYELVFEIGRHKFALWLCPLHTDLFIHILENMPPLKEGGESSVERGQARAESGGESAEL